MKPTVVVSVLTAVLAVGAGIAIAGLPSSTPGADLVVVERPVVADQTAPTLPPVTVQPLTTSPPSTAAPAPDEDAASSTTTTMPAITITTTPSASAAVAEAIADMGERDTLAVATANATDRNGAAGDAAAVLDAVGYIDVVAVDVDGVSPTSTVYHQPGFELEAARLADDLGWDGFALALIDEIPPLLTDLPFDLVAVVGLDES